MIRGGAGVGIIEVKCTVNGMHLNHPETILLTLVHRKIVFHKIGLQCQKKFFLFFFADLDHKSPLEKGMATHSSILAWRIPLTEEPGGLQSTGSQRVRHD